MVEPAHRDRDPIRGSLSECTDAARAALGGGYDTTLELIDRRLVVGDAVGRVPAETPMVALAAARAVERADRATRLADVTELIERCLLADLPAAVPATMAALDTRTALATDVSELMDAVVPLARALRYGTVRRADVGALSATTGRRSAPSCRSG